MTYTLLQLILSIIMLIGIAYVVWNDSTDAEIEFNLLRKLERQRKKDLSRTK